MQLEPRRPYFDLKGSAGLEVPGLDGNSGTVDTSRAGSSGVGVSSCSNVVLTPQHFNVMDTGHSHIYFSSWQESGNPEIQESGNLEIWKSWIQQIHKMQIIKIKIRVAQNCRQGLD